MQADEVWNTNKEIEYLTLSKQLADVYRRKGNHRMAREIETTASKFVLLMREGQETLSRINLKVEEVESWVNKTV